MKRLGSAAYWAAPSLFCLVLYWLGLKAWFRQDDFAWLSLHNHLQEPGGLWRLLFAPQAQGTIRPLSERAFFLLFYGLFGMDALPYRIAVFLTQFANLVLISAIARRLTGSRAAGFLAPVLWAANGALATVMTWTSAYNQALCGFFLLLSFWSLLRFVETGRRRYNVLQWAAFLLGFGALEINVVYPAIAAAYVFVAARAYLRRTLWLFVPSVAFAAIHWRFAPKPATGPYMMHFDWSVLGSLGTYWTWALGPTRLDYALIRLPQWLAAAAVAALSAGLLLFAAAQWRRKNRVGVFLLLWFAILLAPVLPLRDHLSDYYLTTPLIGLAILGAWALAAAWRRGWMHRTAALLLAAVYLSCSLPVARAVTRWNYEFSRDMRDLLRGLVRARQLHPGKIILLTGLGSDLFWGTIYHKAHWLVGVTDVYLAPGAEQAIQARPEMDEISEYVLPAGVAKRALDEDRAVAYSAAQGRLRNVTQGLKAIARARWGESELPWRVDAGSPLFAAQLGPSWHKIEGAYRWMPKRATVVLHGPSSPGAKVYLSGFCAAALLKSGPLRVTVGVDGARVGEAELTRPDAAFDLAFPLPAESVGKPQIEVAIEVDRTFTVAGDGRELGLVFGTVSVR
ncbi:MAG: hypothetical protein IT159_12380 [Bryobacterales bacterium]|nr:hypothetical protein [Bryobacterales bacterium]